MSWFLPEENDYVRDYNEAPTKLKAIQERKKAFQSQNDPRQMSFSFMDSDDPKDEVI